MKDRAPRSLPEITVSALQTHFKVSAEGRCQAALEISSVSLFRTVTGNRLQANVYLLLWQQDLDAHDTLASAASATNGGRAERCSSREIMTPKLHRSSEMLRASMMMIVIYCSFSENKSS